MPTAPASLPEHRGLADVAPAELGAAVLGAERAGEEEALTVVAVFGADQ